MFSRLSTPANDPTKTAKNATKSEEMRPNLTQFSHSEAHRLPCSDRRVSSDQTPVEQLIQALRSPLPEGFCWDFRYRENCAMGLADDLGLSVSLILIALPARARAGFDCPFGAAGIGGIVPLYDVPARDVTPAMVANKLERLIADKALERMMLAEV